MTSAQAQARHAELAAEIRRHDYLYYVQARPVISDLELDRLNGLTAEEGKMEENAAK